MYIDIEKLRTLLNVLGKAEYEFVTTNNLWVTDRPDLVDDNLKFQIDFSNIIKTIREAISELEKLGDIRKADCPVYKTENNGL